MELLISLYLYILLEVACGGGFYPRLVFFLPSNCRRRCCWRRDDDNVEAEVAYDLVDLVDRIDWVDWTERNDWTD